MGVSFPHTSERITSFIFASKYSSKSKIDSLEKTITSVAFNRLLDVFSEVCILIFLV